MSKSDSKGKGMRLRECEVVYRSRSVDVVLRRVASSDDVYRLLGSVGVAHRVTESVWVVLLDARAKLLAIHECARGSVDRVGVAVADVFRAAVITGAASVVLVHNHPSGECSPSAEDDAFTLRARYASELLGIALLDHVVIAADGYYSYCDAGRLRDGR